MPRNLMYRRVLSHTAALALILSLVAAGPAAAEDLPNTSAGKHLEAWLLAHNSQDRGALANWVRESHSAASTDDAKLERLVGFYSDIVEEFPRLRPEPLEIVLDSEYRAVVQFVDADLASDPEPDPARVLLVEIDVDPKDPRYLARGLGLGALFCETRK